MRFHPIADLFPMLPDDELRSLADDIKRDGLQEDIVADDATKSIVDGRNRFQACGMVHVGPRIDYRTFADDAAIARFVMSKNIHRRHLTVDQRAAIGAELATMAHGGNRKSEEIKTSNDVSIEQVAKIMNVSTASIDRAKKRMREDPEAHAAAKAGVKKPRKPRSTKNPALHEALKAHDDLMAKGDDRPTQEAIKAKAKVGVRAAGQAVAYREGQESRDEEVRLLKEEIAGLTVKMRVLSGTRHQGDRVHDALTHVEKLIADTSRDDPARKILDDAMEYIKKIENTVQRSMLHLNKKLAHAKEGALRVKIEALAERGATDGERSAGSAALKRLTLVSSAEEAARTLPRTREELLARKRPLNA